MKKWALITGATAGIGKAAALKLASSYNLIICGRRTSRLQDLQKEISSKFAVEVHILSFDIQDKNSIQTALKSKKELLKNVSVLVNNAGLARGVDKIDEANTDDWDQMIDTNIKGLLYMTRFMMPYLMEHSAADIVNIGSVSGRWTYPGGAVYCGTKHAVRAITEGMRQDLNGKNIRVACIEPGLVATEFSLVRLEDKDRADKVYEGVRVLSAEDIAETIFWTLSRPAHVNIQELVIYPTDQAAITMVHRE